MKYKTLYAVFDRTDGIHLAYIGYAEDEGDAMERAITGADSKVHTTFRADELKPSEAKSLLPEGELEPEDTLLVFRLSSVQEIDWSAS